MSFIGVDQIILAFYIFFELFIVFQIQFVVFILVIRVLYFGVSDSLTDFEKVYQPVPIRLSINLLRSISFKLSYMRNKAITRKRRKKEKDTTNNNKIKRLTNLNNFEILMIETFDLVFIHVA